MTAAIRYIVLAELSSVGWIRTWIARESPVAISTRNRKNLFNAEPPSRINLMRCVPVFYMNSCCCEVFFFQQGLEKETGKLLLPGDRKFGRV
jgi:hypothetical protein